MTNLSPLNSTDPDRVTELARSLRERGWVGPPIVTMDGINITGSHRLAALSQLEREGIVIAPEMRELADILADEGIDLEEIVAELEQDYPEWELWQLMSEIPDAVCERYGLDVH